MNEQRSDLIVVTCAIIEDKGKILCAQRSESMDLPLKWEFPGGKVEKDEDPEACLTREIREELGLEISLLQQLPSHKHRYSPGKTIELVPFRCQLKGGHLQVREHRQVTWLPPEELTRLDWADADIPVVACYQSLLNG